MVDLHGNSMKLEDIRFPLYVVHSDEVMRRDGILWIDGAVLDDTNVEGQSIGERRLRTPLKNMYDLKHQIDNLIDECKLTISNGYRAIITTLTKKMSFVPASFEETMLRCSRLLFSFNAAFSH